MRVVSISEIVGDEPLTISPVTLCFSAARMELAFREQLSEIILDGIPSEACWLVLGSALGYANFVLDAFGSGQTSAAVIPLAALGLAAVLATPALCLQGLFDWAPSRVLSLLASCASVLLLACPLATSVLCTATPCSDGDGWRLAASAQDALLVVSVLSTLFAGLPMLHGCLPVLVAAAAQAVVLAVRRETLFGEHHMAIECLRRGSCLLLLLLLVVFGVRRREALDRAAFLTAEGGVELAAVPVLGVFAGRREYRAAPDGATRAPRRAVPSEHVDAESFRVVRQHVVRGDDAIPGVRRRRDAVRDRFRKFRLHAPRSECHRRPVLLARPLGQLQHELLRPRAGQVDREL